MFNRRNDSIIKCKKYIEGEIEFDSFWNEYINDEWLKKKISKVAHKNQIGCVDNNYFDINPESKKEPDFRTKALLQWGICFYLKKKKINYNLMVKEYYLYSKWNEYIPSFIPYRESIYQELESLDGGIRHSKKYYRDYYSKIYTYEKYPPKWMHMSEWPFDEDGSPTKFLYQTGFPNNNDFIEYFFQRKDGTKIKIEQYD